MKKIYRKRLNNKGFTLVELLAVIVVLAIVMGIAAVAITNVLDSTRKNAFVASARSYIAGAKTLVNADQVDVMLGQSTKYAPACPGTKQIAIADIKTENPVNKSPYGADFKNAAIADCGSFVLVTATQTAAGVCDFTYSIYLTDGNYAIGTAAVGGQIAETSLAGSTVLPVSGS